MHKTKASSKAARYPLLRIPIAAMISRSAIQRKCDLRTVDAASECASLHLDLQFDSNIGGYHTALGDVMQARQARPAMEADRG